MRHKIDPTVDCVFKALLGSESHTRLLIHFLNAIIDERGDRRVAEVTLNNPYNFKDYPTGKLSEVDVKATDQTGRQFQIDIQLCNQPALAERILYNWSSIYSGRLAEGEYYTSLAPVISIWLLAENLFPALPEVHLPFGIHHPGSGTRLSEHCEIHLLQLKNWPANATISDEKSRWIGFFHEGKHLDPDGLPGWMHTDEMREAMSVLEGFSEKEENYLLYLSRLDRLRNERTQQAVLAQTQRDLQQMRAEKERERTEKERERTEKKRAVAEIQRLRDAMKRGGLDPDEV